MGTPIRHNQASFSAGEISPRLYGRVDLKYYQNGLYTCLNMIPFEQGALTRRTGTHYVATAKSGTANTLLIPFTFNTVQAYILEFGDQYMRVYRNRGQVIASGTTPYEISTPWLAADVPLLKFTQSADILYVFHGSYPPQQISRTADNSWTIAPVVFTDGPYLNENSTSTTLQPGSATGSTTMNASSTTGINGGSGFLSTDVGRFVRYFYNSSWGYATITAVGSTTSITVSVSTTLPFNGTGAVTTWQLGAWSATTGYPGVVTLFGERLYAANTNTQPDTFWGSVTGNFVNMSPTDVSGTVADDSALTFTLNSDEVNAIYSMVASRVLFILTSGSEWSASGGSFGSTAPITPTNIVVLRQTNFGSRPQGNGHRINNKIIFATRSGRRMYKSEYQFASDSYNAQDITEYANHITGLDGINYFDLKLEPDNQIWAVREQGGLISLTYNPDENVIAWAQQQLGGTDVSCKSVAIIPSPDLNIDDVWLLVQRTVNGQTVQFVEYIGDDYLPENTIPDEAYFVDAGLQYDGYYVAGVTLSATTGNIVITADASVFSISDVGKQFKDSLGGTATVTAYVSGTVIDAIVIRTISAASFTNGNWSIGAQSFSGVTHLENEVCDILADGAVLPQVTISNTGTFTLDNSYSKVAVGLHYQCRMVTLPIEEQLPMTQQGLFRRISRIHLRFLDSVGFTMYTDGLGITPEIVDFRTGAMNVGVAIPLYNGLFTRPPPSGYDKDCRLAIEQNNPLPMTILSIIQELDLGK